PYKFGPSGGKLWVKTDRGGVAFLVGKDLTIEVTSWEGKLDVGDDPSDTRVELTADGGSLKVTDGTGGPVTLTDLDKKSLSKTINEKVLEGTEIKFRSETARPSDDGSCIDVTGELEMFDEKTSLEFRLTIEQEADEDSDAEREQRISGRALFKQTEVGLKPHSTLLGLLRARDQVEVTFEGKLEK